MGLENVGSARTPFARFRQIQDELDRDEVWTSLPHDPEEDGLFVGRVWSSNSSHSPRKRKYAEYGGTLGRRAYAQKLYAKVARHAAYDLLVPWVDCDALFEKLYGMTVMQYAESVCTQEGKEVAYAFMFYNSIEGRCQMYYDCMEKREPLAVLDGGDDEGDGGDGGSIPGGRD